MAARPARRIAVVLAAVMALALTACSAPAPPSADRVISLPDNANLLFVARAASGSLEATGDTGTLTLDALTALSWFTDRPARQAGMASVEDAIASLGWSSVTGSFGDDPPNAELTADELSADSLALELQSATVDGTTVSFEVAPIGGGSIHATTLTNVELFIDDGDTSQTVPVTEYGSATTVIDGDTATVTISVNGDVVYTATLTPQSSSVDIEGVQHLKGTILYFPAASGQTSTVDAVLFVIPGSGDDPDDGYSFSGQLASWTAD